MLRIPSPSFSNLHQSVDSMRKRETLFEKECLIENYKLSVRRQRSLKQISDHLKIHMEGGRDKDDIQLDVKLRIAQKE